MKIMNLLKYSVLIGIVLLLNNCESKAAKFAEEETNECIAQELNKLDKPFRAEAIDKVRHECGTLVNEMMKDMKPEVWE